MRGVPSVSLERGARFGAAFRCALLLGILGGCFLSGDRERPSLLLVTIDTLRADHLGCYGYERAEAPVLDGIAARGVRFESAYTPIPITLDGEIAYADHELGRLLAAIPENALVVIAGDHGEAFGEHGQWFDHGGTTFEETMRVPLLFAGPWGGEGGRARPDLVSLVDLAPTILDRLGLKSGDEWPGRALFADDRDEPRAVYCETMCSRTAVPTPVCFRGLRGRNWSYVARVRKRDGREQQVRLHSLLDDPEEMTNLGDSEPDSLAAMRAEYDRLTRLGTEDDKNPSHFWPFTDEDGRMEGLRALAYVE